MTVTDGHDPEEVLEIFSETQGIMSEGEPFDEKDLDTLVEANDHMNGLLDEYEAVADEDGVDPVKIDMYDEVCEAQSLVDRALDGEDLTADECTTVAEVSGAIVEITSIIALKEALGGGA